MLTLTTKYRISWRRGLGLNEWSPVALGRRPVTSGQPATSPSVVSPGSDDSGPNGSPRRARSLSLSKAALGFTLLEVMVSVAIMSIVLVSVYKLHSQSLTMNMEARFYTQAPMLAQSKLSEMETNSEDEFSNDSGDFGEDFPGFSWSVAVDDVDIEALGEISKDLKKIEVTVSYNENEFVYNLRTYRLVRNE